MVGMVSDGRVGIPLVQRCRDPRKDQRVELMGKRNVERRLSGFDYSSNPLYSILGLGPKRWLVG